MARSFEDRAAAHDPPPGFVPISFTDGFLGHNGPIYARRVDDTVLFGCRVLPYLCNPMGVVHGGWVATLFDVILPLTARYTAGFEERFLLTVQMGVDYLAGAKLGDWIEGRAQVLRTTRRMIFIQGTLEVDGALTARGSGIFRIGPPAPPTLLEQSGRQA
ncbi:PaaI family thioesterase [Sphingobium cupriresistens]|uniref:Thioesterase n=1 Tax=Sphingobium cupriresistens LL01 TaxID=1420583 RepID=A0A0J7XNQ4_9SPHN|nr:PaaI family thioesterase [Sphingobium cupriresistens]KMS53307.1 thioesterase [Sphingobium cupriresistens LL01]